MKREPGSCIQTDLGKCVFVRPFLSSVFRLPGLVLSIFLPKNVLSVSLASLFCRLHGAVFTGHGFATLLQKSPLETVFILLDLAHC